MNETKPLFRVSSAPHIASHDNTRRIMIDVLIALIPTTAVATFFFGTRVLALCVLSVFSSVFFEWLYRFALKKPSSIGDGSACVTGLLFALTLPVTTPYWVIIAGSAFAIVVVKQLYGGIGKNFMNPALAARVFVFLAFPTQVNTWQRPMQPLGIFDAVSYATDAVTSATPLMNLDKGSIPSYISLEQLFVGEHAGSMGEVASVALILGGLYLVLRHVITLRIPVAYLGTVALLTFFFPQAGNDGLTWMIYQLLTGGVLMAAIFMATDYSTSPVTRGGQWIYGVGCGLITVFIRYFGTYPEGVSFAILVMNACVWLFDKWGAPRRFGVKWFPRKEKRVKRAKGGDSDAK